MKIQNEKYPQAFESASRAAVFGRHFKAGGTFKSSQSHTQKHPRNARGKLAESLRSSTVNLKCLAKAEHIKITVKAYAENFQITMKTQAEHVKVIVKASAGHLEIIVKALAEYVKIIVKASAEHVKIIVKALGRTLQNHS